MRGQRFDVQEQEAGLFWDWGGTEEEAGRVGPSSGSRGRVSSRGGNGVKRLSKGNAGCSGRRKHFVRLRGTLAKMRLVGKQVAAEDTGSFRGAIARALTENMIRVAATHATTEPERVFALEVSRGIDGEVTRRGCSSWLITAHGLFRR